MTPLLDPQSRGDHYRAVPRTADEYEAEIAELRAQLARQSSRAPLRGTLLPATATGGLTVTGAEEMILQLAVDDTVGYLNRPMAKLLGVTDRKSAIGGPVRELERAAGLELGLEALSGVARASSEAHVLEREMPDLEVPRLPRPTELGDTVPVLRFVATPSEGRVHIVVQDVTRQRWLEEKFSRYVPAAVIEQMQLLPEGDLRSTERRDVTILFADLRGFDALCDAEDADAMQAMVSSFFEGAVECVERLNGTVDSFSGDTIVALFGAPMTQPDHALRGLLCAAEIQRAHVPWMERRQARGLPTAPLGVGLASGPAIVGSVGTSWRSEFTALGRTVSTAARLSKAAGPGDVLTLRDTHAAAIAALDTYDGVVPVPRMSFRPRGKLAGDDGDGPEIVAMTVRS